MTGPLACVNLNVHRSLTSIVNTIVLKKQLVSYTQTSKNRVVIGHDFMTCSNCFDLLYFFEFQRWQTFLFSHSGLKVEQASLINYPLQRDGRPTLSTASDKKTINSVSTMQLQKSSLDLRLCNRSIAKTFFRG